MAIDIPSLILTAIGFIGKAITILFQFLFGVTLPSSLDLIFGGLILASIFFIGIKFFNIVFKYILIAGWILAFIAVFVFIIQAALL